MSHRTKGNVKPSNSERVARLLPQNAFMSFSEASQTLSSVYNVKKEASKDANATFEFDISSDFQVVFKHMSKKDVVTRMKALQDFSDLAASKNPDELLKVGKFWFRIYRKMANMIDWRLRQEVHQTLLNFVNSLGKERTLEVLAISLETTPASETSNLLDSVSFQKTVTMPAVLWTSCYDPYAQAADAAYNSFTYLYSTPEEKVDFLFQNHETILDYCVYSIFEKIPIKLFYTTDLPSDSVKSFEEHILVTTMRGLFTMINELICYYLQAESIDINLQKKSLSCLRTIFLRVDGEFVKRSRSNRLGKVKKEEEMKTGEIVDEAMEIGNGDQPKQTQNKKDKKKKMKKDQANREEKAEKLDYSKLVCRFWDFDKSESGTVRLAMCHLLNSFTRLTTLLVEVNDEEDIFEESFDKEQIWFHHYKLKFYETIFGHLFDSILEVKGLSWLLATHLFLNPNLYKPWATLDVNNFLERLATFIARGMRSEGGLLDFGLFNLNLQRYALLYPEYFAKKVFYLSAQQMVFENEADVNQAANVKLIIIFAQSFPQQKFRIFGTMIASLNDGLRESYLRRDVDFMLELYYNLIYYYMHNCYQLASKDQQAVSGEVESDRQVKAVEGLSEEIFCKYLLEVETLNWNKNTKVSQTPIYLNLLLLTYHTNQLYHDLSSHPGEYDLSLLVHIYEQFKTRVAELYSHMFSLVHTEILSNLEGKSVFRLDRMLKFLNEAIFFRNDGYFSSEYYYSRNSMSYDVNAWKIASSTKTFGHLKNSRRVRFGGGDNDQKEVHTNGVKRSNGHVEINGNEEEISWWHQYQSQSIFVFSLANLGTQRSFNSDYSLSLYNELPSIQKAMNDILLDLWRLFDRRLITFDSLTTKIEGDRKQDLFNNVLHLQYVLRGFSSYTLVRLCPSLTKTAGAKTVNEYVECVKALISDFFIRWLDTSATFCDMIDDGRQTDYVRMREELRYQVLICRKIYDVLLVLLVKLYDLSGDGWQQAIDSTLDVLTAGLRPYSYCVLVHHLSQLSTLPLTSRYAAVNIRCKEYIIERFCQRSDQLVYNQLDRLFTSTGSVNLNCNIFIDLLSFSLNESDMCYAKRFPLEFKLRVSVQVLDLLYRHLESKPKQSTKSLDYQLFPSLCSEIYKILFQHREHFYLIQGFDRTLASFIRLFLTQTFEAFIEGEEEGHRAEEIKTSEELIEVGEKEDTFDSSVVFYKLGLTKLFETLPMFEGQLKNLVTDSFYSIRRLVFENSNILEERNYLQINKRMLELVNILVSNFKTVVVDDGLYEREAQYLNETRLSLTMFTKQLAIDYSERLQEFVEEIDIGVALWEFSEGDSLYAAFDLFLGRQSHQLKQKLIDLDKPAEREQLFRSNFRRFEKLVYTSNCVASLLEILMQTVFLEPSFEECLSEDSATSALLRGFETNFSKSIMFRLIKSMLEAGYYLERFLKLWKVEQPTKNGLPQAFKLIETKLISIVEAVTERLSLNSNDMVARFALFVVQDKRLAFGDFCLANYFRQLKWRALLETLGREENKSIDSSALSEEDCLRLVNFSDVAFLKMEIRRVLDIFGLKEGSRQPIFDWSKMKINTMASLLVFCRLLLHQLREDEGEGVQRLRLALLSLNAYLQSNDLDTSDYKWTHYIFILYGQAIQVAFDQQSIGRHHRALFAHQKNAIQELYSNMPDGPEKVKEMPLTFQIFALNVLNSFNQFGTQVVEWVTAANKALEVMEEGVPKTSDVHKEVEKEWRNFLAFDSFNVLLPIFVAISQNYHGAGGWLERILTKTVTRAIFFLDPEALTDIATLEANQVLLLEDEDSEKIDSDRIGHLKSILAGHKQNSRMIRNLSGSTLEQVRKTSTKMLPLTTSNEYYDYVLRHGIELLMHADPNWALSSYQVLAVLMKCKPWKRTTIINDNERNDNFNEVHRDQLSSDVETCLAPPDIFFQMLSHLERITYDCILEEHTFGQIVNIAPGVDTFNYPQAYLFGWLLYLHMIEAFPLDESRAELINFIIDSGMHTRLLSSLFHLLPEETTTMSEVDIKALVVGLNEASSPQEMIEIIEQSGEAHRLERLAMAVYYRLLVTCPIVVRLWYTALRQIDKQTVESFTEHNLSSILIAKELANFEGGDEEERRTKLGNIVVKVFKRRNEIVAVYSLREICFEIKFDFKTNYPLTAVGLECTNRSGVNEDRCRRWMQRLNRFFNKQNCSVYEGLVLIRPNMDKFFEDIEECIICLFVLFGSTGQLPRFRCPQCKKKFHWNCIRKWFQQNASCPQCKYAFD